MSQRFAKLIVVAQARMMSWRWDRPNVVLENIDLYRIGLFLPWVQLTSRIICGRECISLLDFIKES